MRLHLPGFCRNCGAKANRLTGGRRACGQAPKAAGRSLKDLQPDRRERQQNPGRGQQETVRASKENPKAGRKGNEETRWQKRWSGSER